MKRSTRRRLRHGSLYVLLLAVVLVLGFTLDWSSVQQTFFNTEGLKHNWHDLVVTGVKNTVIYTAIAFAAGLVLAVVLALMKLSEVGIYRWLATVYIEFFRGLPALVTILAMGFGFPIAFGWRPPGGTLGAGLIGLVLVAGAYMAETIRAGIQAVPKGQTEASRSLGMSSGKTMTWIVLPQAFRIIVPPLTNEMVLLIKDTSLLAFIGATVGSRELTNVARDMMTSGASAGTATSLTMAGVLYLVITLPLTRLVAWMEKKQRRAR
ncbi:amino acid ABC transporter permease [Nocardioides sp. KR10-350]|uniref:amino acid ABC transporter permease n=1 Tax=Nocardioides cheoyonin TaxID=3156615 RepID=UPI0032B4B136